MVRFDDRSAASWSVQCYNRLHPRLCRAHSWPAHCVSTSVSVGAVSRRKTDCLHSNASRKLYEGYFKAKGLDGITRNAKQVYKDHYDHIRASFSPERMLNYELGSGWQSLCDFLGEPVPTAPFPHVNEQNELKRRVAAATQQTLRGAYWAIVKYLIIPLVAIGAGLLLLRR